jgi:isopenicillin N synthase-like dioxygenase
MTAAVPVIDIGGFAQGDEATRTRVAQDVSSALEEIGFLVVQGHDVNPETIAAARELAWRFFDLPLTDKMRSRKPIKGAYRGYVTADDENLSYMQNEASPPDLKEFFGFGQFGYGDDPYYRQSFADLAFPPNIWPEQPVGFKTAAMQFYREMGTLTEHLLRIFEKGLGLDQGYFRDKFDHHASTVRFQTTRTKRTTPCRVSCAALPVTTSPQSPSWRSTMRRVAYRSNLGSEIGWTSPPYPTGLS